LPEAVEVTDLIRDLTQPLVLPVSLLQPEVDLAAQEEAVIKALLVQDLAVMVAALDGVVWVE
jgi:hypothetical protein